MKTNDSSTSQMGQTLTIQLPRDPDWSPGEGQYPDSRFKGRIEVRAFAHLKDAGLRQVSQITSRKKHMSNKASKSSTVRRVATLIRVCYLQDRDPEVLCSIFPELFLQFWPDGKVTVQARLAIVLWMAKAIYQSRKQGRPCEIDELIFSSIMKLYRFIMMGRHPRRRLQD